MFMLHVEWQGRKRKHITVKLHLQLCLNKTHLVDQNVQIGIVQAWNISGLV